MATNIPNPNSPQGIYGNPLRALRGIQAERIDMGVDYGGSGPVYPIGPAVIEEADASSGWPGGGFIKYRITEGPLKGKRWYVAEHISPSVKVGDKVDARTVLGQASGGGIETGYAGVAPQSTAAQEAGQIPTQGDPGAWSTGYGIAASETLQSVGAPPGQRTIVTASSGGVPQDIERALVDIGNFLIPGLGTAGKVAGGLVGGAISNLTGIGEVAHWFGKLVLSLTDIHMWISLGWVLLGAWMIWLGISLWLKLPQKAIAFGAQTAARAI